MLQPHISVKRKPSSAITAGQPATRRRAPAACSTSAAGAASMVAPGKADKAKPPVFHDAELARGFRVLREHLALTVDLQKRVVRGTATLTLAALNTRFVDVALNLRRCAVRAVRVNGQPAPFHLVSALDDDELLRAVSSDSERLRIVDVEDAMRRRTIAAAEQPELTVNLPANISADIIEELEAAFKVAAPAGYDAQQPAKVDAAGVAICPAPALPLHELPIVAVVVEYEALDPTAGAVFYGDRSAAHPNAGPRYMATDGRHGMARCWMPCVDSILWCDRHPFDLDISVQSDLMVVASGDLVETRLMLPSESSLKCSSKSEAHSEPDEAAGCSMKIFSYRLNVPAHAAEIAVAVGPFMPFPDPALPATVTHFCLPGRARELVHTSPPLFAKALAFCRDYFGCDPPCTSFKQLFLGPVGLSPETTVCAAGGVAMYSGDLLYSERCIDEGFAAREAVMLSLVTSYFGRLLRPRAAEDNWLIIGVAAHVSALGLQTILGRNWFRFRMLDLMRELSTEPSRDAHVLSVVDNGRVTDLTRESVCRRAHVIVYMIARRIGGDIMRRALRDMVAEGRSVAAGAMRTWALVFAKLNGTHSVAPIATAVAPSLSWGPSVLSRTLENTGTECDDNSPLGPLTQQQTIPAGVGASGFDDAVNGVSVGPFLKRLRAICGTDVRSLVRLWASSRGVPRMQIAYQYNPRRHQVEFVVKQEAVEQGALFKGREGLGFSGSLHVKVMEVEGAFEHSVEIRDPVFLVELPCHSRRAKHKSAAQAEKEFQEDPIRASPVLWVRVDPDLEWCKDTIFKQKDRAWISILKSERDAIAQYEACRGLALYGSATAAKALSTILEDPQTYWRVRAEAAQVLAGCDGGLDVLLNYCRARYTDPGDNGRENVRPNDFVDMADYFVRRAIVRAIVLARVPGSRTAAQPEGSVPMEVVEFLLALLKGNDNAGNKFDDHHYVVDLLDAAASVGVLCINDRAHVDSQNPECSSTARILKQIERYRALDRLIPSRAGLVSMGVVRALSKIEVAKLVTQDAKQQGSLCSELIRGRLAPNASLLRLFHEFSGRSMSLQTRAVAMSSLAMVYGGDLEVVLWLLVRVDRTSVGDDIIALPRRPDLTTEASFMESGYLRRLVLEGLIAAAESVAWKPALPPILAALRRPTKRAMQVCVRIFRLVVGDADERIRVAALRFAHVVWGNGVPVCLFGTAEYIEAKACAELRGGAASFVEPTPGALLPAPSLSLTPHHAGVKGGRRRIPSSKRSGADSGLSEAAGIAVPSSQIQRKTSLNSKRKVPKIEIRSAPVAPTAPRLPKFTSSLPSAPLSQALPRLQSVPRSQAPAHASTRGEAQISRAAASHRPFESKPRAATEDAMSRFSWHPMDEEDMSFMQRAWREQSRYSEGHQNGYSGREGPRTMASAHSSSLGGEDEWAVSEARNERGDIGRGSMGEDPPRKKKKKRRRSDGELDGDGGGSVKKKKKKKKIPRQGDELSFDAGNGNSELGGSVTSGAPKIKIRLNRGAVE